QPERMVRGILHHGQQQGGNGSAGRRQGLSGGACVARHAWPYLQDLGGTCGGGCNRAGGDRPCRCNRTATRRSSHVRTATARASTPSRATSTARGSRSTARRLWTGVCTA